MYGSVLPDALQKKVYAYLKSPPLDQREQAFVNVVKRLYPKLSEEIERHLQEIEKDPNFRKDELVRARRGYIGEKLDETTQAIREAKYAGDEQKAKHLGDLEVALHGVNYAAYPNLDFEHSVVESADLSESVYQAYEEELRRLKAIAADAKAASGAKSGAGASPQPRQQSNETTYPPLQLPPSDRCLREGQSSPTIAPARRHRAQSRRHPASAILDGSAARGRSSARIRSSAPAPSTTAPTILGRTCRARFRAAASISAAARSSWPGLGHARQQLRRRTRCLCRRVGVGQRSGDRRPRWRLRSRPNLPLCRRCLRAGRLHVDRRQLLGKFRSRDQQLGDRRVWVWRAFPAFRPGRSKSAGLGVGDGGGLRSGFFARSKIFDPAPLTLLSSQERTASTSDRYYGFRFDASHRLSHSRLMSRSACPDT